MRAGRDLKAERGGYAGFGSPPFGLRADGKELVPDHNEQAAVALILELREQGRSLAQIVEVLHEEGNPAKRGGRWHPQTVSRVLHRTNGSRAA